MKNKELTFNEIKELEELIYNDLFLDSDNRKIDYFDEIRLHFSKLKLNKKQKEYLLYASVIPLDELILDIKSLENGEYKPSTFIYILIEKYFNEEFIKKIGFIKVEQILFKRIEIAKLFMKNNITIITRAKEEIRGKSYILYYSK